jgi:HD-GYP domain-containing protein (c-di-GMP phosphodiesterase class II)
MSVVPSDHPVIVRLSSHPRRLVPLWTAILAGFVLTILAFPALIEWLPLDQAPVDMAVMATTVTLALIAASRYWNSYRYSRFPLQIALFLSASWLAVAQVIMSWGELWRLSWWSYHFLLLSGMILMVVGLVRQYGVKGSLGLLVAGLPASNAEERLDAALSPSVRALVVAVEARDPYTAGHNYRVALGALHLGQAMGLAPEQMRALAQGGVVHDVGKIAVGDSLLNKPERLTEEERRMIQQHPLAGFDMCARLGFMKDELDVIRSHHERWDGSGYPDGLKGEEVPLLARILAIADVYDALTSDRSYRKAWSHADARAHILSRSGSHFDPACVAAWARLTEVCPASQETASRWPVQARMVAHLSLLL